MEKSKWTYFILETVCCIMAFVTISCGPAEQKDERGAVDSTDIANKKTTDTYESSGRGIEDSVIAQFIRKYPEMQYAYLPTEDGKITTVKGNFQVDVDGITAPDDLNKFIRYIEENYENRAMERNAYNRDVAAPAKPKRGYEAYYDELEQNLQYPNAARAQNIEATVFVEFIVNENGEITNVEAVENTYRGKDPTTASAISKAAVEAVRTTDWQWTPAKQDDQLVKMKIEIPVAFATQE